MKMTPCSQDSVRVENMNPDNNFYIDMEDDKALNYSYDSDHTIEQPVLKRTKKVNFRQRIRSLREECDDGVLLASSEELSNAVDDDEGFIVACRRNKRNQKNKNIVLSRDHEEEEEIVNENTNPLLSNNSIQTVYDPLKPTSVEDCNMQSVMNVKIPDTNSLRLMDPLLQKSIKTQESEDKLLTRSEEPNCRLVATCTKSASDNLERKPVWDNTKNSASRTVVDFDECPICYQPWGEDRVILEECGHSFHSECIRSWMKRKNTCPFCAGFSLLPDEFPHLT